MADHILDTIGNTPLVQLQRLCPNPNVTLLVKLEYFNPGSSIKDRIVRHIINEAEREGKIAPGGTIVEGTSGNTGAAVALIAAIKGYHALLVVPDKVSREKQDALKAFGADLVVCPTNVPPDSPEHYTQKAKALAKNIPNSYQINQYDNPKNTEAHYLTTGPEIWKQTGGKVDYFVAAGSTGGTVSGVGRFLKEQNPKLRVVMPDPVGSIYYEYFNTGKIPKAEGCTYFVEGIGEDHIAHAMDFSVVDEMLRFNDADAFDICRRLAREEGILAGGSTGANVWGALEIAKRCTEPTTIVTVAPDGGIEYLSKIFNDEWMETHNLLRHEEAHSSHS